MLIAEFTVGRYCSDPLISNLKRKIKGSFIVSKLIYIYPLSLIFISNTFNTRFKVLKTEIEETEEETECGPWRANSKIHYIIYIYILINTYKL